MLITAGPACFLDIVLKGIRNLIMHDEPDITLVHPHPESRCGDHYPCFSGHERILVGRLLVRIHFSMKGPGHKAVIGKSLCQLLGFPCSGDIYDCRTIPFFYKSPESPVFLLFVFFRKDSIVKVAARGTGRKMHELQGKFPSEISTDILNDLDFRRGRKAGYRYAFRKMLLMLQVPDEFSDIKIIDPEVLSPRRKAMCLVYHEPDYFPAEQQSFNAS